MNLSQKVKSVDQRWQHSPQWIRSAAECRLHSFQFYVIALVAMSIYFSLAKLGLFLASLNENTSPVWPATGFAMALLILCGKRYWVSIAIGAFLANFQSGLDIWPSSVIALGNSMEGVIAAVLYHGLRSNNFFANHSHSFASILSSLGGGAVSATVGCFTLYAFTKTSGDQLPTVWLTWWIGDVIGGITVFPQLFALSKIRFKKVAKARVIFTVALSCLVAYLIFHNRTSSPFLFLAFPFLLFCTTKLGRPSAYIGSGIFSIVGVMTTYYGEGIFSSASLNTDLMNLQIFLSSIAVTALFLPELWTSANNRQTAYVLIVSWGLAAGIFYSLYTTSQSEIDLKFSKVLAVAEQRLAAQEEHYLTALKSGVGLFSASRSVEKDEWTAFAREIGSQNERSGLMGIGVIFKVAEPNLKAFLSEKSLESQEGFTYRSLNEYSWPKEEAYVITYLEPHEVNAAAVGLDIATEISRKKAADRAAKTHQAALTDPIRLVQVDKNEYGFLVLYPFYGKESAQFDERSKIAQNAGWIYSPINANSFFRSAFGPTHIPELSYAVYKTESNLLLSHSDDFFHNAHREAESIQKIPLEVAGQSFTLAVKPSEHFSLVINSTSSWAGATVVFIGILLASLVSNLQSTRERVEEIVKERSRQLDITGNVARVGGWDVDRKSRNIRLSPVAKAILGFHEGDSPSMEFILSLLENHSSNRLLTKKILIHDFALRPFDITLELNNAAQKSVWVRIIAMPNSEIGASHLLYGTIQDVSEQKEKDLMLVHASKMASLGEMASGVAHEINNPLMIITAKVHKIKQILRKELPNTSLFEKELEEISKTILRIANIIKGLKTFSRNCEEDPFLTGTLATVIDDSLYLCAERFRNAGISLRIDVIPQDQIAMRATQISQVILNLLNNSFDAISDRDTKWIQISFARSHANFIDIRVTDSGPPIPAEVIEKIMQPFFTTKEIGKGTGIGLSISRGIAQSHNGDLFLDKTSSNTTFVLRLPCII